MQESRHETLIGLTTVTSSGAETGVVRLARPATGVTLFAHITTASGSIKIVLQRGIHMGLAADSSGAPVSKQIVSNGDVEWFDYAAFTTTSTAGKMILPLTYSTSTSSTTVTSTGAIASNTSLTGPLGSLFRGAYQISGAGATFTLKVVGEFEF